MDLYGRSWGAPRLGAPPAERLRLLQQLSAMGGPLPDMPPSPATSLGLREELLQQHPRMQQLQRASSQQPLPLQQQQQHSVQQQSAQHQP